MFQMTKEDAMNTLKNYSMLMSRVKEVVHEIGFLDKEFDTLDISEPPQLISGEQKSNGGLFHPHLKGFDEPKRVSDTRLLEGLLTVLLFTLFSPGYAVRFPKLSARQRPKSMLIGR